MKFKDLPINTIFTYCQWTYKKIEEKDGKNTIVIKPDSKYGELSFVPYNNNITKVIEDAI